MCQHLAQTAIDPTLVPTDLRSAPMDCIVSGKQLSTPAACPGAGSGTTYPLAHARILGGPGLAGRFAARCLGGRTSRGTSLVVGSPAICNLNDRSGLSCLVP